MDAPRDCHAEWGKSDGEGEISCDTWNLRRSDTNELTYKRQTLLENKLKGVGRGSLGQGERRDSQGAWDGHAATLERTATKDPLLSTGDPAQCRVAAWMGAGFGGERTHGSVWLSPYHSTAHRPRWWCSLASVESDPVWPYRLDPARLLRPRDSAGKRTEVGCHALLQGVFPTQGSNPGLLHHRQILYHSATREACKSAIPQNKIKS